jgi:hypothetical protein
MMTQMHLPHLPDPQLWLLMQQLALGFDWLVAEGKPMIVGHCC